MAESPMWHCSLGMRYHEETNHIKPYANIESILVVYKLYHTILIKGLVT